MRLFVCLGYSLGNLHPSQLDVAVLHDPEEQTITQITCGKVSHVGRVT